VEAYEVTKTRPLKGQHGAYNQEAPDPILKEPAHRRMALGAQRGLKVVAVFYAVTLIGFAITLGHLFDGRSFGVVDVGLMYLTWGLIGGALGGLAAPMARGALSSIPVVTLIFLPLAVAVTAMDAGWRGLRAADLPFVLAASLFMGLIWGPLAWRQLHKPEQPSPGAS
jgi:hypothetical protein